MYDMSKSWNDWNNFTYTKHVCNYAKPAFPISITEQHLRFLSASVNRLDVSSASSVENGEVVPSLEEVKATDVLIVSEVDNGAVFVDALVVWRRRDGVEEVVVGAHIP